MKKVRVISATNCNNCELLYSVVSTIIRINFALDNLKEILKGILPVIQALIEKGVPIGTALSFMMATTALSVPEFVILKQIMKPKLIFMFAGIVSISIVIAGYLFNLLFGR
jgi:uncharacterized membrane protein YraQ (UPF0718 family)